jgi:hypothetical protein
VSSAPSPCRSRDTRVRVRGETARHRVHA